AWRNPLELGGGVADPPAVGVQRVTDDEAALQPLLVAAACVADSVEDGQDSGGDGGRRLLLGQVGRSDDPRHASQRLVGELVLVDEGLEGAAAAAVTQLRSAAVERAARGRGHGP